ncbi:MAG: hypothetical protein HKO59_09120 [Phycisphaerales bacterium]|nr:hypothetical protein [Phycisphaerae bacterium]NNF43770.1 hypothetical protein [Phycisphaerales bacterium]NNM26130.1 hypothetical protein [Phycisphaerales bacterium]
MDTCKKSAPLICGALLASVAMTAEVTMADPGTLGLTTSINGISSVFSGSHVFGGATTILGGGIYTIEVDSALSTRPGFDFEVRFNVVPFSIGFFGGSDLFHVDITGIKAPGDPQPIDEVAIKSTFGGGAVPFNDNGIDGGNIRVTMLVSDVIAAGEDITIQWNQIPAPGAIGLLAVAGVVGGRRRRRA